MSTDIHRGPTLPVFNLAPVHEPAEVLEASNDEDVMRYVVAARRSGHRVHALATGHGLPSAITGGAAVLTHKLAGIDIDSVTGVARVGAGATWGAVAAATSPYGWGAVGGSAPGVGVTGFLLGGGLSPVGREFGWGSDHVRSFELVTASGDTITASAHTHPDLFWALRGGNTAPGIITQVELKLVPLINFFGGGLFFDVTDAEPVLSGYADWAAQVPSCVTSSVALLQLPDAEIVPPPLRGRFLVHVRVAIVHRDNAEELVAPLRSLARPIVDALAHMPYAQVGAVHADPTTPMPVLEGGALLTDFPAQAVGPLLEAVGPRARAPFAVVELRQMGGALGDTAAANDAVVGRDAGFCLFAVSAPVPDLFPHVFPAASQLFDAMSPWSTGRSQPNFTGTLNTAGTPCTSWSVDVLARLRAVWANYDPTGLFTGLKS